MMTLPTVPTCPFKEAFGQLAFLVKILKPLFLVPSLIRSRERNGDFTIQIGRSLPSFLVF